MRFKGEGLGPEQRVFCWRQDHALYESYFTLGDLWGIIRYLTPTLIDARLFVMNMTANQMTLRELLKRFPDEAACRAFLAKKRWPDGIVKCPRCGEKAYTLKARPFHYLCKSGKQSVNKETGEVSVATRQMAIDSA